MADEIEGLKAKIKELEIALEAERKRKGPMREKIEQMSSEVVDSNPYRYDKTDFLAERTKAILN